MLYALYGSETIIRMEKQRSRVRAIQLDDLRSLLVIRRVDRAPNAGIRVLYEVKKEVDEKIDENVL